MRIIYLLACLRLEWFRKWILLIYRGRCINFGSTTFDGHIRIEYLCLRLLVCLLIFKDYSASNSRAFVVRLPGFWKWISSWFGGPETIIIGHGSFDGYTCILQSSLAGAFLAVHVLCNWHPPYFFNCFLSLGVHQLLIFHLLILFLNCTVISQDLMSQKSPSLLSLFLESQYVILRNNIRLERRKSLHVLLDFVRTDFLVVWFHL